MAGERGTTRRTSTDQRLLQQTLLGEAIQNARVAVFVFDEDRQYVAANEYACELSGYTRKELLAADAFSLSGRRERADRLLAQVRRGARTSGRGVLRHKDGREIPVDYRVAETRIAGSQFYVSICWPTGRRRVS